uniref:26 kDa periplasmic immunogenic protein n=1 Tax=Candidatus Methanophagaceae archaeon ANME-1 ERB6 TaxID=2759912 RepID=A0A7G9YWL2_9EURY|nr:hypothetical protein IAKEDICC_00017 [Methanosarcinales archaeon ANME-1 ERB6]
MKLYSLIAILAVCLAIVSGLYINSGVTAVNSEAKQGNSTISVSGTGAIETEPNQAKVCLGVETQSKNVTEALDENSLRMTAVIEAMKALGISKDNIETTYFNIYPVIDYENKSKQIEGYKVNNEVTVELDDLGKIGKVIEEAINTGANRVRRIEFDLTEDKKKELREEAIKEACDDARAKADAIASGLGLELVRVSAVSESGVYVEPYREVGFEDTKASAPPIAPKEVKVSATINVVYECR